MRFDVVLLGPPFRNLKLVLETLIGIFYAEPLPINCQLIYFVGSQHFRLLIESQECVTILAFDKNIIKNNACAVKEGAELLSALIKDGHTLLSTILHAASRQQQHDIELAFSKQSSGNSTTIQSTYRCLKIISQSIQDKVEIQKPTYDSHTISSHEWLSGYGDISDTKISFILQIQHLLNLLRIFQQKAYINQEKFIELDLLPREKMFRARLPTMKHNCTGGILDCTISHSRYEGNYGLVIMTCHAMKLYDVLIRSSEIRLVVDKSNKVVICYEKTDTFECHTLLRQWILCRQFEPFQVQTKLQSSSHA